MDSSAEVPSRLMDLAAAAAGVGFAIQEFVRVPRTHIECLVDGRRVVAGEEAGVAEIVRSGRGEMVEYTRYWWCAVVTGDGRSLAELARRHGFPDAKYEEDGGCLLCPVD